jgi:UTP:GlnB (protein PII) uridylyltransferase
VTDDEKRFKRTKAIPIMEIYSQPYRRTTSRLSVILTRTGDAYRLTVETFRDAPGTLYRLCAVLVRHDWNIESAEICTHENQQVVDRFVIRPASKEAVDEIKFEEMMKDFEHLLFENLEVRSYIAEDVDAAARPTPDAAARANRPVVEYSNKNDRGRLVLSGADRSGLLLDIAGVFAERDIDILEARIETTADGRVRNSFLINPTDTRFDDEDFRAALTNHLRTLL